MATSDADREPVEVSATPSQDRAGPGRLCVLLACFEGAKRASHVHSELGTGLRASGGDILDEVVLTVSSKGKAAVYDPRRTIAGALTAALTWGLFGLVASGGSWKSIVFWGVVGAICGAGYAYLSGHLLSKNQLKQIGDRIGPDSSALAIWAEAPDAERLLAAAAPFQPTVASVAAVDDDLSAKVFVADTAPAVTAETGTSKGPSSSGGLLTMLLLRYPGERTARAVATASGRAEKDAARVELVLESAKSGKRRVISPAQGVGGMAKSDVVSWGLFGLVWGAIVGVAANGGIIGSIESGVVIGVLWAIFGLFAGALYGLWAGRAVSARRLKSVGQLLPPDSSAILAWADGAVSAASIGHLSTPDATTLALRFNSVPRGAVLSVGTL